MQRDGNLIGPAVRPRLMRLDTVLHYTGLRRSNLWRLISRGQFPAPIKLGVQMRAW